ncbi:MULTISPECIES: sodium-dependent bicarbonate transport family permease [unclassified Acidovorax]|uniref:sodium-dependent bicarbonate transport family permease n=1 Tax=unclassified Acidovorax TaxID=2684926 RepID=UPI0023DE3AB1|nr:MULTISPECIES: sodium-dependent bicarbonate transport family permease [unclassified Acidovorax]GKS94152.1 sodium-dependent bicarbonate transport family permease [Acidovorax sp. SUPP2825]GKT00143.1 sodium-dependent bicarbonate transport family permease [Acidovorax sp. SUPP3434]
MKHLLDPAILFFVLGLAAGLLRSNLEIPAPLSRFLSLYLLMALGLKGGFALAQSGWTVQVSAALVSALVLAVAVPAIAWCVLRRLLPPFDAAAVAATYGSVSAVTFVTASHLLEQQGTPAGGYMAAAMALMESPAIVLAVVMAHWLRAPAAVAPIAVGSQAVMAGGPGIGSARVGSPLGPVLREALTDGGAVLLLGALLVGLLTGAQGEQAMHPFTVDLFKGLLAFFLLDMGLMTARSLPGLAGLGAQRLPLALFAVVGPVAHGLLALGLAKLAGLAVPEATLLAVLGASASYIAVPAVLRHAMPEARPALYVGLSLGVTFPFNLVLGIPLYGALARWWLG